MEPRKRLRQETPEKMGSQELEEIFAVVDPEEIDPPFLAECLDAGHVLLQPIQVAGAQGDGVPHHSAPAFGVAELRHLVVWEGYLVSVQDLEQGHPLRSCQVENIFSLKEAVAVRLFPLFPLGRTRSSVRR